MTCTELAAGKRLAGIGVPAASIYVTGYRLRLPRMLSC